MNVILMIVIHYDHDDRDLGKDEVVPLVAHPPGGLETRGIEEQEDCARYFLDVGLQQGGHYVHGHGDRHGLVYTTSEQLFVWTGIGGGSLDGFLGRRHSLMLSADGCLGANWRRDLGKPHTSFVFFIL